MKKKNIVNAIKQIEGLRKEKDDNSMKDKLINTINYEMEQVGNTDVVIDNIRFFTDDNKQHAMADVSYTWWLNAWDKRVYHKDMIFTLVDDDRWISPIFG